jgi:hypothetical protein
MELDEDDDFYAPEEPLVPEPAVDTTKKLETSRNDELEEGEEEDESGEMDEDDDDSVCEPDMFFSVYCFASLWRTLIFFFHWCRTSTLLQSERMAQRRRLPRTRGFH